MMNFKNFKKEEFLPILKRYGFSDIDDSAFVKLVLTIEVLVYNMLNNVLYVTDALKISTLKKQHFEAVMSIMQDVAKTRAAGKTSQSGGHAGTTFPSEYYGIDSGRYFQNVSELEQSAFAEGLTRAEIQISPANAFQTGGRSKSSASSASLAPFDIDNVKSVVEKFRNEKYLKFKVSSDAYAVILTSLLQNLQDLLKECKKARKSGSKLLTQTLLFGVMSKQGTRFAHMNYVWKN